MDACINTLEAGSQLCVCLCVVSLQELFIHGLGAAIHRAINLSLQLKETSSHSLKVC